MSTSTWTFQQQNLANPRAVRISCQRGSEQATYADVISAWQADASFRSLFNACLADSSFQAFRWETPPVTTATQLQSFECVLLDSPGLARQPEPEAFAEHFHPETEPIVVFPNLGRDAIMIVPSPLADHTAYGHLAAFVRLAPEAQIHALWQSVGKTLTQRTNTKPVWLSTAGAGVSWLHVRLDDRPKYYGYTPYRTFNN